MILSEGYKFTLFLIAGMISANKVVQVSFAGDCEHSDACGQKPQSSVV